MSDAPFDAIVVGSGITGGWAAKELTERGLRVIMIERGRMIEHQSGYTNETVPFWELPFRGYGDQAAFKGDYPVQSAGRNFDEWTRDHFVNDTEHPYQTSPGKEAFQWRRGYQLGGRSLIWGRQCYRWSDLDFGANALDGNGTDWPIRYADLAPWYDHVEDFIGVSGSKEGLAQLPDGNFQPPMPLNAAEKLLQSSIATHYSDRRLIPGRSANLTQAKSNRAACQHRNICARGCSYGAYFSTQSSTLPAAMATGRLTLLTDTVVERVLTDDTSGRATGVRVRDANGKVSTINARIVFLCAGAVNTVGIMLRSSSDRHPAGLGNQSGVLGRYFMDHANTVAASIFLPDTLLDRSYYGNRPINFIIPRFRNLVTGSRSSFLRGYSFQGGAARLNWPRGGTEAGIGSKLKNELQRQGGWKLVLVAFAESIPRAENRITLADSGTDKDGLRQLNIILKHGANERAALADAEAEAKAMLAPLGGNLTSSSSEPAAGGTAVHEMGGARMGRDPTTSVLNGDNQVHDIPNLFVTDGSAMASSACQNPSLTYMALTARACATAATMVKAGAF